MHGISPVYPPLLKSVCLQAYRSFQPGGLKLLLVQPESRQEFLQIPLSVEEVVATGSSPEELYHRLQPLLQVLKP